MDLFGLVMRNRYANRASHLTERHKPLYLQGFCEIGAGGRTRTDTTFEGPGILSPVRLPFRHTGNYDIQSAAS